MKQLKNNKLALALAFSLITLTTLAPKPAIAQALVNDYNKTQPFAVNKNTENKTPSQGSKSIMHGANTNQSSPNTSPYKIDGSKNNAMLSLGKQEMSAVDRKILQELFISTLKPLSLKRIENDRKLLNQQEKCVQKSQNPQEFKICNDQFLSQRRDNTEIITQAIDREKLKLEQKYKENKTK